MCSILIRCGENLVGGFRFVSVLVSRWNFLSSDPNMSVGVFWARSVKDGTDREVFNTERGGDGGGWYVTRSGGGIRDSGLLT